MTWNRVPLESIATELQAGFACQPSADCNSVPQLRTNNVSPEGNIDLADVKCVPASKGQIARYRLKLGDILFNNTNSPALVGKTAYFEGKGLYLFSNHMTRIRVDVRVANPRFIAQFLHWSWSQGALRGSVTQWVNQAAINRSRLASVLVPLPPLSEQHRIAEILGQAGRLRRLRTEADFKAHRIVPVLFLNMFGDPVLNPKQWPTHPIGELAVVTTGNTPPRARLDHFGHHIEWIKSDNLNTRSHYLTPAIEWLSESGRQVGRTAGVGATLVTCIAGSPSAIGNAALANREVAFNQQINAASPKKGVNPYFLYAHFLVGKRLIQAASSGGMKGLVSKTRFSDIHFLLPPPELQERFGKQCKELCDQNEARIRQGDHLHRLFSVLSNLAFRGDLTALWREAHMKELLQEMELQAKALAVSAHAEIAQ